MTPPVTNSVELVDAWHDLQGTGTHTNDPTPEFLIHGDGGLSRYACRLDGHPIGEFQSDGYGRVYVQAPDTLKNGAHALEVDELAPHPAVNVAVVSFVVDTKAEGHPVIEDVVRGPGVLAYVTGHTSLKARVVQIRDKANLYETLGGTLADEAGKFRAAIIVRDPKARIVAVAYDDFGNLSKPSGARSIPKPV